MRKKAIVVLWMAILGVSLAMASVLASGADHENPGGACNAEERSRDCGSVDPGEAMAEAFSYAQVMTISVPADYPTIQEAINAAGHGDTVLVARGTYTEHINVKSGIALVCDDAQRECVISEDDPPSIDSALVTCENCDEHTLIEGFTIKGANGHRDAYGHGMILLNSDVKISNNSIVDNFRLVYSGPSLIAYRGQGIAISGGGKPRIIGNFIHNNRTYRFGGGVSIEDGSGAIIIWNIFKGNRVFNWGPDCDGGGLAIGSNDVFVSNNVFDGNTASGNSERGGGIYISPGLTPQYVGNNVFVNNLPFAVESDDYGGLSYSVLHENSASVPALGTGIISADPQFINPGGNDYHLGEASPAIDSGEPKSYFSSPEDPDNPGHALYPALGGLRNDIGAYGGAEAALIDYATFRPPTGVIISGPTVSFVQASRAFTATVDPVSATLPITYVWQASEHETITQTGGLSDEIALDWLTIGDKHITVTATNAVGSVADSHAISITAPEHSTYLPLILKMPATWAENHSYTTTCAEEDNINVPVFAANASQFSITATHPTYEIGSDNCDPDFSGCTRNSRLSSSSNDVCTRLFEDGITIVEGCTVENWWRPYGMQIRVGSIGGEYHYLVLYRKIDGAESWPQFLVLYEDGNMRLKPHARLGQSDVCFGSSVIVGPVVAVTSTRPYVDIREVEVHPTTLALDITYRDGGSSRIVASVNRTLASAVVDVYYSSSHTNPVAAFRSMFVADGNADVDHVISISGTYPIDDEWTLLAGPYWSFMRTTRSQHNTSAPDIRLEISE